jgi:hypothetical protein
VGHGNVLCQWAVLPAASGPVESQRLSPARIEYGDSIPEPVRIAPTSNWAGRYDGGIGGRCIVYGSQQVREVVWAPGEREDDTGTIPLPGQGGGPQEHCVRVAWPAQALWMNLARRSFGNGAPSWTGSLVRPFVV